MAITTDLFDRCIDLYIYGEHHELIGSIVTPEYGSKPEIKVEGTILSSTYQIAGKVTVTNLERSVPVESARYLIVEMYYKGSKNSQAMRKKILYTVMFADQSKQPPNRQVCFNCLVAGTTPDLMAYKTSIGELDANDKPIAQPLSSVLSKVIAAYNTAVAKTEPSWTKELQLDSEPDLRMSATTLAKYKSLKVATQWSDTSLSNILDSLALVTTSEEPIVQGSSTNREYLQFNYYIENNKLVVAELPSNAFIPITGQAQLEMSYVLSAYRYGPQVHVKSLFDPRIHQDIVISINPMAVSGKKVAGDLLPIVGKGALGFLLFRPVGGISFVFSTTGENWMQMQGTMYV